MEQKIYKYKDYEFKHVKKNLTFRKNTIHLTKRLLTELVDETTGQLNQDMFLDFLHDADNVKAVLSNFLEGDISVINVDLENDDSDDEYFSLLRFISEILTDFFSSLAKNQNTSQ